MNITPTIALPLSASLALPNVQAQPVVFHQLNAPFQCEGCKEKGVDCLVRHGDNTCKSCADARETCIVRRPQRAPLGALAWEAVTQPYSGFYTPQETNGLHNLTSLAEGTVLGTKPGAGQTASAQHPADSHSFVERRRTVSVMHDDGVSGDKDIEEISRRPHSTAAYNPQSPRSTSQNLRLTVPSASIMDNPVYAQSLVTSPVTPLHSRKRSLSHSPLSFDDSLLHILGRCANCEYKDGVCAIEHHQPAVVQWWKELMQRPQQSSSKPGDPLLIGGTSTGDILALQIQRLGLKAGFLDQSLEVGNGRAKTLRKVFTCNQCNMHPQGYGRKSELQRHQKQFHSEKLKQTRCIDASPTMSFLQGCKECMTGKLYDQLPNAAGHLRRMHFNLSEGLAYHEMLQALPMIPPRDSSSTDKNWPPMDVLKEHWLEEVETYNTEKECPVEIEQDERLTMTGPPPVIRLFRSPTRDSADRSRSQSLQSPRPPQDGHLNTEGYGPPPRSKTN